MGDLTPKLELFLPAGGSTGTIPGDDPADIDKLNENFREIDAAMGATSVTSTTRPAAPYEGQIIYETDTKNTMTRVGTAWVPIGTPNASSDATRDALYPAPVTGNRVWRTDKRYGQRYDGTAWKGEAVGLVPMVPSSVIAGATVAGAKVSFTAAGSVLINGVFTTEFDNYRIMLDIPTIATPGNLLLMRLVKGGTLDTANYSYGNHYNNASAMAASVVAGTAQWILVAVASTSASGVIDLIAPMKAQSTRGISNLAAGNSTYISHNSAGLQHNPVDTYDGFWLAPDLSAGLTGTVTVFGYNQL